MLDLALERSLHEALRVGRGGPPPLLREALDYAVFPGGARVRPRLLLEVARACGDTSELAYAAACSVELLHCASLVHDDLPCFDAAATRRGRASVHRVYGEAMAVLVGDGLMVQGFYVLARATMNRPEIGVAPVLAVLDAAGPRIGLVAGQAWELEKDVDVVAYHRGKTASLFEASAALGALVNGVEAAPFAAFGRAFGMAYQLADDVADVLASAKTLGKPTGRDRELRRPTAIGHAEAAAESLDRLRLAGEATAAAVPSCARAGELRLFVDTVFAALQARCRHSQGEKTRLSA